jgi:hypothetical protein
VNGAWDGYSDYGPGEPLPPDVAKLFPSTTAAAPGHQAQPSSMTPQQGDGGKRKKKQQPSDEPPHTEVRPKPVIHQAG